MNSTLASLVTTLTSDGSTRQRDVPIRVEQRARGGHLISINRNEWGAGDTARGPVVDIHLTEAERVALIEALGGQPRGWMP